MNSNENKPPFHVGQQVARKLRPKWNSETRKWEFTYGGTFTVSVVEFVDNEWVIGDCYLNIYKASSCIDVQVYNSPLYKLLSEK